MTKLDLIDTTIQPDPFKPQVGDVYEFGHPFPQRLVVEDAPSSSDFRIRFRIDGGDSNLTSVRAFHLLLAGFRGLCGVGRVAASESARVAADAVSDREHETRAALFSALGREDSTLSTLDLVEQLAHALRERDDQINTLSSQRDRFFDDSESLIWSSRSLW